jgi:TRAP-type C4-dicarboxylate transport system permease small subunit
MMVYTVGGVVMRTAGHPIKGTTEYVTLIFVFVIMLAISFAQRRWEHLAMGVVFDRYLSPKQQRRVLIVLLSIGIFICFLLTWSGIRSTVWAFTRGDTLLGAIQVPTWWARMAIPIGLGIATVRLVVQLVQIAREGLPGGPRKEETIEGTTP